MNKNMTIRNSAALLAVVWLSVVSLAQTDHVFYRETDGHMNHIWYDGTIHHDQWTVDAKAPKAAGDAAPMVTGN